MERMRHQMPKSDTECFVLVCVDSETSAICGTVMTTLHHYDFDTAGRADTDSFGSLGVAVSVQGRGIGVTGKAASHASHGAVLCAWK
jgi:hypothetical protein